VAWLSSKDGALACEKATERGNPYLDFTEAAQFLKGRKLSTFAPQDTEKLQALITKYTGMLRSAGAARGVARGEGNGAPAERQVSSRTLR
jgi:hypothetical protein